MTYNETGSVDEIASTKAVQTYFQENLVWLGADDQPVETVIAQSDDGITKVMTFVDGSTGADRVITGMNEIVLDG